MFKFLKDKLKNTIKKVTKSVEPETEEIDIPKPEDFLTQTETLQKNEQFDQEVNKVDVKKVTPVKEKVRQETNKAEVKEEFTVKEKIEQPVKEKQKFFTKLKQSVLTTKINEQKFDDLFWDLEVALLENNVAFEVIEKIKNDLKKEIVNKPIKRGTVEEVITKTLKLSIESLFNDTEFGLITEIKSKKDKPYVIVFIGANGSGKTTTIAKIAYLLQLNGLKPCLAAADTWRSAAIQQLESHAKKLNIPIVKHNYGSDPAAVAFDAIKMAKARNLDAVLIDTAGRQHSNLNLIDEMKKIVRVTNPDLKVYVGEMIAGNDCIEQVKTFDNAVNINSVILTKADVDEKGGTAISLTYVTNKPILYLGTGQEYKDLIKFNKELILKNLGL